MTADELNTAGFEKPYRVTIWRVQKGYVRYQVHAESIEDAVADWITLGKLLRNAGEMVEGDKPDIETK